MRRGWLTIGLALVASVSSAQTTTWPASVFKLTTGPCLILSDDGSPEGAKVGSPCDTYVQTNPDGSMAIWSKVSGVGTNTGWQRAPGLGLVNTWTATQALQGSAGAVALKALVTGDTYSRFYMTTNGVMWFGDGIATQDVALYRMGANLLYTPDLFRADTGFSSLLATSTTTAFTAHVTAESYARFTLRADGRMEWGGGSAARDVSLYRSAANVLATDDTLLINGNQSLKVTRTNSGEAFAAKNAADSQNRVDLSSNGTMQFGSGAAVPDTNLYRAAANLLQTDDSFYASGGGTGFLIGNTAGYYRIHRPAGVFTFLDSSSNYAPIQAAGATFGGHVLPSANNTYELGSATYGWAGLRLSTTARLYSPYTGATVIRADSAAAGLSALTVYNASTSSRTGLLLTEDGASTEYGYIYRYGTTAGSPRLLLIGTTGGGSISLNNSTGVTGSFSASGVGSFQGLSSTYGVFTRAGAGDTAVNAIVAGESYPRLNINAGGTLLFGSGSGVGDTNLYRSAANVLRTDDGFVAANAIQTNSMFQVAAAIPRVNSYETDALTDEKYWEWIGDAGQFYLRTLDDSYLNPVAVFGFDRAGTTPSDAWMNVTFRPYSHWTLDLGLDGTRWRTVYGGELNVWQLVAKTVTAVNGELVTADTTKLTAALAAGSTTITVADNSLADGDVVLLKSLTNVEFLEIDSAPGGSAGLYTYTVIRNRDGTGANDWPLGQAVMNTGVAGEGFIDQFSTSSEFVTGEQGPTVAWMVRNSATWNDVSPRTVAGNLKGYYGYSTNVYGLAAGDPGDVYITAEATNGFRVFEGGSPRGQWAPDGSLWIGRSATGGRFAVTAGGELQMHDSSNRLTIKVQTDGIAGFGYDLGAAPYPSTWVGPTGVSIFYNASNYFRTSSAGLELVANGVAVLTATTAGNLSLTGTVNALAGYFGSSSSVVSVESGGLVTGADGVIRSSGATAFSTGVGFWLKGGSSPQFRVGDPSGQSMIYEDGDLYIYGDGYNLTPDGGLLFDEATAADDYKRAIRWASNGSVIMGRSDIASLHLRGPSDGTYSQINFYTDYLTFWGGTSSGGNAMELGQDGLYPQTSATLSLGLSNRRWSGFHLEGVAYIYGMDTTTAGDAPVVFSSGGNRLYAASGLATDSALGSCGDGIYSLEVRNGLVVGATCVAPDQSLRARVLALERETAALRAMVAAMGTR